MTGRANPFVGPRALEGGAQPLYGRDAELRELHDTLRARRVVVLHAPSGAGKTSLIQAGLVPELWEAGFDVCRPIRVHYDLPPDLSAPERANRFVLSTLVSLESELPKQRSSDALAALDLATYVRTRPQRRSRVGQPRVLIFDQFEEILTAGAQHGAARRGFFDQLAALLADPAVWVLFSLREDYLGALAPWTPALPTRLANTVRLGLLSVEAAAEVARRLASSEGREFPAAEQLARDLSRTRVVRADGSTEEVHGGTVEPVQLQVVCRRLWDEMDAADAVIDADDVAAFGDVARALRDYVAGTLGAVGQGDLGVERALRDWVEARLVVGGVRVPVRKEPGQTGGVDTALLDALVDRYLLRTDQRAGATWYELAHDRLVEPLLADNARWRDAHLSPTQRAALVWDANGRSAAWLPEGEAFAEAMQWREEHQALMSDVDVAYLLAAIAREAVRKEQRKREQGLQAGLVGAMVLATLFAVGGYRVALLALDSTLQAREQLTVAAGLAAPDPARQVAALRQSYEELESERRWWTEAGVWLLRVWGVEAERPLGWYQAGYQVLNGEPIPVAQAGPPGAGTLAAVAPCSPQTADLALPGLAPCRTDEGLVAARAVVETGGRVSSGLVRTTQANGLRALNLTSSSSVALSPSGATLVEAFGYSLTGGDRGTAVRAQGLLAGQPGWSGTVDGRPLSWALSADGARVVGAESGGRAWVWDGDGGQRRLVGGPAVSLPPRLLSGQGMAPLAMSGDGRTAALTTWNAVLVLDVDAGEVHRSEAPPAPATALALGDESGAETPVLVGMADGTVGWLGERWGLRCGASAVIDVATSGDVRRVAAMGSDGAVCSMFRRPRAPSREDATWVAEASHPRADRVWFAPHASLLFSADALLIRAWRPDAVAERLDLPFLGGVVAAAADAPRLYLGGRLAFGRVLDLSRPEESALHPPLGEFGGVAAWSADGSTLATSYCPVHTQRVCLWDPETGDVRGKFQVGGAADALAWSGGVLWVSVGQQMMRIDPASGALSEPVSLPFAARRLLAGPGGSVVAVSDVGVAGVDPTGVVWQRLAAQGAAPTRVDRRGHRVLVAQDDALVVLDAATGAPAGAPTRRVDQPVSAVALSGDARVAAVVSAGGGARVGPVDEADGPMRALGTSDATAVALSADAARLALGHSDGSLSLWRVEDGARLARLTTRHGAVTDVAFWMDEERVVTTHGDRGAVVWRTPADLEAALWAETAACLNPDEQQQLFGLEFEGAVVMTERCEEQVQQQIAEGAYPRVVFPHGW